MPVDGGQRDSTHNGMTDEWRGDPIDHPAIGWRIQLIRGIGYVAGFAFFAVGWEGVAVCTRPSSPLRSCT